MHVTGVLTQCIHLRPADLIIKNCCPLSPVNVWLGSDYRQFKHIAFQVFYWNFTTKIEIGCHKFRLTSIMQYLSGLHLE